MKKLILLVILVFIFVVWFMRAPIVSFYFSSKLKMPISIEKIEFSKNLLKFVNLKIKDRSRKVAFLSKSVEVNYSFSELRKTPAIIKQINISDSVLKIECKNPLCSSNNWTEMIQEISKKEKSAKEYIIDKLILDNLMIEVSKMGLVAGSKKDIYVKHIEFNEVSSKDGFPTQQIIYIIFKSAGIEGFIKEVLKGNIFEVMKKTFNIF